MLSDLLHSALKVLRSVPEDIWYDGIACMLSARFALHIRDPEEGTTRMLIVALAKDTLPVKQCLCSAGIHRKCPRIWRGVWWGIRPPSWAALRSQEVPLSLDHCVMSWVVKQPLTIPGTLARLRWGAAPTVPSIPVAWLRQGMRAGIVSHPLTALEHPFLGS